MSKGRVLPLWLAASALVILLAGCYSGSSNAPSREISAGGAEVDGSLTDRRASVAQSDAISDEGSGRLKIVKFTVPTIT